MPYPRKRYKEWLRSADPVPPRSTANRYAHRREAVQNDDNQQNNPAGTERPNSQLVEPSSSTCQEVQNLSPAPASHKLATDAEVDQDFMCSSPTCSEGCESEEVSSACSYSSTVDSTNVEPMSASEDEEVPDEPQFPERNANIINPHNTRMEKNEKLDLPLHPGLEVTKFECLLMIFQLVARHGLTGVAFLDVLKFINKLCGSSVLDVSKYKFDKIFQTQVTIQFHFFCTECNALIGEKSKLEGDVVLCPVNSCQKACDLRTMNDANFFITLPIMDQVKFMFENTPGIEEKLQYRWSRKVNDGVINDVFDGYMYQQLSKDGCILSDRYNIGVQLSTDGAQVFDASHNTMWPIQLRLLEPPPKERYDPEYWIVCGIWFGKKEPNMTAFLSPCVTELSELEKNGFYWKEQSTGKIVNSKIILLNCCVDSKAKPAVQFTKQFNGYFGCSLCTHPGVVLNDDSSTHVKYVMDENLVMLDDYSMTYTVSKQDPQTHEMIIATVEDRTDRQMRSQMRKVVDDNLKEVQGVMGMSPLFFLQYFNLIFGFCIDYLHAVLLGVMKLVASFWLESAFSGSPFHISHSLKELDRRLLAMKPPSSVSRRPRGLSDRKHWKANEWRNFLLFYSLPCLKGILPAVYLKHHCLLVTAIHTLLKDNISLSEIESSSWLLGQYVLGFQQLYGRKYMFYNVHLLLHLGKCVFFWGPLWCYSLFSFEAGNGVLVNLVKGSSGVATQISQKYARCKFIFNVVKLYNVRESILDFCDEVMTFKRCSSSKKCDEVTLLGKAKHVSLTQEEAHVLQINDLVTSYTYDRFIKNGVKYHAKYYARQGVKSCDAIAQLNSGKYVELQRIIVERVDDNDSVFLLARDISVVNEPIVRHDNGTVPLHIKMCVLNPFTNLNVYSVEDLKCKSMIMSHNDDMYIGDFPNFAEKD